MLEIRLAPRDAPAPVGRCSVASCAGSGSRTPVLRIALAGSAHVSRVRLPAHLCPRHASGFSERFLTEARRASIELALRTRGRKPPDWSRTDVVLE